MAKVIFLRSQRRKWCNRCKEYQPYEAFGHNKGKPEGLGLYCKACERKRAEERYKRDPDAQKERSKEATRKLKERDGEYIKARNREGVMRYNLRERYKRMQQLPPEQRVYRGKYQHLWEEIVFSKNAPRKGSWKAHDKDE